jgi:hypothetical protein
MEAPLTIINRTMEKRIILTGKIVGSDLMELIDFDLFLFVN